MKQAFSGIILLFIVFVLNVYLVAPKYTQLGALKNEVAGEELTFQQKQGYLLNLQKIIQDLETHKEALERIESALPKEFSLPSLLNFFQIRAAESGLILKNISQAAPPKLSKKERRTPVKVTAGYLNLILKGTILSFESFLKVIEKSSRLMEVELISLKQGEGQLPEFSLLVKVYSY